MADTDHYVLESLWCKGTVLQGEFDDQLGGFKIAQPVVSICNVPLAQVHGSVAANGNSTSDMAGTPGERGYPSLRGGVTPGVIPSSAAPPATPSA